MRKTNFRLSEDQERDLVEYCMKRVEELRADNEDRIQADKKSWDTYELSKESRKEPDTIFDHSNVCLPLTSMIAENIVARAEDEVTGTSPYFHFTPAGPTDGQDAKSFDRYFQWKRKKSSTKESLEDAYVPIAVQRACILKAVFSHRESQWMDHESEILFDKETGEPIELLDVGFIVRGHAKFDEVESPDGTEMMEVLRDDPSFHLDESLHEWRPAAHGIRHRETIYRGAKTVQVDYDAFLCPSRAPSVEEADFVAELYDKRLSWVKENYLNRPWQPLKDYIDNFAEEGSGPKTETERNDDSKENLEFDKVDPTASIIECWVRRDVLEWGTPQEFVVFLDAKNKKAIYYEYKAKVCPDLRSPYTAISIGRVKGKWCAGKSLVEKISQFQEYADKQFNSESYRNELAANPIIGLNPDATEEEDEEVELMPGKKTQLKPGMTIDDYITFAALPSLDTKTHELIEFVFSLVQLWLGVTNLQQGDYADVPRNNTATGIRASMNEASKLGRRWIRKIINGFEDHLMKLTKIDMETMDKEEAYEFLEGDSVLSGVMTPREIQNVEINVSLVVSRKNRADEIESARIALEIQDQYMATPPELRPIKKPLFEKILSSLGYDNTQDLLPEAEQPQLEGPKGIVQEDPQQEGVA